MLRICTRCGIEKELELFTKGEVYKGTQYYRYQCKACTATLKRTGKPNTGRFQKGSKSYWLGKKLTEETKKKIGEAQKGRKQKSETIEKKRQKLLMRGKGRQSQNYQIWRNKVLERDSYKCVKCGSVNRLHCHHLIAWNEEEIKRLQVENGQTLCASCHGKEGFKNGEIKSENTQFKKGLIPWNKGKTHSEESKKKMRESSKGQKAWNKGLKKYGSTN